MRAQQPKRGVKYGGGTVKVNDYLKVIKTDEVSIIYNVSESKGSKVVYQVLNDSVMKGYFENELQATEQPTRQRTKSHQSRWGTK